jgi:cytochrome c556
MNNPDWPMLVQGLRDAGKKAYEAGQSKNQDKILDAADAMTTACANCHDKYRDKPGGDAARCK